MDPEFKSEIELGKIVVEDDIFDLNEMKLVAQYHHSHKTDEKYSQELWYSEKTDTWVLIGTCCKPDNYSYNKTCTPFQYKAHSHDATSYSFRPKYELLNDEQVFVWLKTREFFEELIEHFINKE
jgi:hypothetical protein